MVGTFMKGTTIVVIFKIGSLVAVLGSYNLKHSCPLEGIELVCKAVQFHIKTPRKDTEGASGT